MNQSYVQCPALIEAEVLKRSLAGFRKRMQTGILKSGCKRWLEYSSHDKDSSFIPIAVSVDN